MDETGKRRMVVDPSETPPSRRMVKEANRVLGITTTQTHTKKKKIKKKKEQHVCATNQLAHNAKLSCTHTTHNNQEKQYTLNMNANVRFFSPSPRIVALLQLSLQNTLTGKDCWRIPESLGRSSIPCGLSCKCTCKTCLERWRRQSGPRRCGPRLVAPLRCTLHTRSRPSQEGFPVCGYVLQYGECH